VADDLHFYFDPVCPFAWITSKWVRLVMAERGYTVQWRFISLRIINDHLDYDADFPPDYDAGHTAGQKLLRVAAATRAAHGHDAVAALYEQLGLRIFEVDRAYRPYGNGRERRDTPEFAAAALAAAGLPVQLADALGDDSLDAILRAESEEALALTGRDVGTPILHFAPPNGLALFGPVISQLPPPERAGELWDHVVGLAGFAGFAELKRSLRARPKLPSLGG
jgi:2-hydroxychromene-2-carboxylate isomerase